MSKLKTTGDLREFLCSCIEGLKEGTLDVNKARNIYKLAAQINENLHAEVKVAQTDLELNRKAKAVGNLILGRMDAE